MQAYVANLLVLIAGLFCGTALVLWKQRSSFSEQLELRAGAIAAFLATQSEYPLMVGDREELQRLVNAAVKNEGVLYVVVAGESGQILAAGGRLPAMARITFAEGRTGPNSVREAAPHDGLPAQYRGDTAGPSI